MEATMHEAKTNLTKLVARARAGEEVVITRNREPVARLVAASLPRRQPRRLVTMKGTVLRLAPDFDGPLEEFGEYME